jgi:hypothetical protein
MVVPLLSPQSWQPTTRPCW